MKLKLNINEEKRYQTIEGKLRRERRMVGADSRKLDSREGGSDKRQTGQEQNQRAAFQHKTEASVLASTTIISAAKIRSAADAAHSANRGRPGAETAPGEYDWSRDAAASLYDAPSRQRRRGPGYFLRQFPDRAP